MSQQTRMDMTDLRIMKLTSRDSRTPHRNIASAVGIMSYFWSVKITAVS
jgi:DNA-binding Lrp family transcriptional regulator